MAREPDSPTAPASPTAAGPGEPKVQVAWDDRSVSTVYANVVDGFASKDELTLLLGTLRPRRVGPKGSVQVTMSHQVILSPSTAKRLLVLLSGMIAGHEKAHGEIVLANAPHEAPARDGGP